jgi:phage terminase large subunit
MTEQRVIIPYQPRPLQRALHGQLDRFRWNVAVCHRRFGKTVLGINQLLKCAMTCDKPRPRFAYIAPFRNQAKDVAWSYLKHYTLPIPGSSANETELSIDLPNSGKVRIYGADNENALRGIYLDGVVLDEYGDMSPTIWGEVIRPLLSDRQGWAFFIGTPNGKNQFYDVAQLAQREPGWSYTCYKASETGILPDAELADARRTMTEDQYLQEYECSYEASIIGAVYAKEMTAARESGRIARVAYDPRLPVDTAWDLGHNDATAIWLSQTTGHETRLIRYYESSGQGLHHYVGKLKELAGLYGYAYGDHYLPHDVAVTELGTGQSRLEILRSLGLASVMVVPRMPLDDGINATRMFLPLCYFDAEGCERGIEALRHYRWAPQGPNATGNTLPVHDWSSHGADAIRMLATAPRRSAQMVAKWNAARKDDDPLDRRLGRGKYRTMRQASGSRGGW